MVRVEPDSSEIQLLRDIETEYFETRLPVVLLYKRINTTHKNLDINVDSQLDTPLELNANWDSNKTQKELRDGFYVETKKIEMRFCVPQLEDKGVDVEKGDVIELDLSLAEFNDLPIDHSGQREQYEVLQTRRGDRIKNTSERLHLLATIDLEHKWSS